MCAAAAAVRLADAFCCCVTSQPAPLHVPDHQTPAAATTSLAADTVDKRNVASPANTATSSSTLMMRCPRYPGGCRCHPACQYITVEMDDPSIPVPVCCCERCDGGWFPPEVSLRMRSCLLACDLDHVTTGKTACDSMRRRHCTWSGDVMYLDDAEKAEMSLMSRDFKGVDLLVCIMFSTVSLYGSGSEPMLVLHTSRHEVLAVVKTTRYTCQVT